ncbi:metal ABC transporter substrate-binding protein, partial [uncultured Ruminobacter sp.]
MKNILRQKVSAGIFGASLLGSLFFGGAAQAADDLTVLTSFGIIEDITRNIAGDKAKVKVIVPTGSDPHAYNLSASNMIDMEKSSLIVINGLSFEGYLERYLTQDKYAHKIVVASAGVEEQEFVEEHHAEKSADEHEHDDHDNDEHEHGDC